mmetsp:Transcript_7529/g.15086  ORF Transcript_7529/g.15086 Transcript_7529/m.15086 type:complete len:378 (+) Transcript_7529:161-1294(+)
MEREIVPHGNDILMGRGGKNNQHVGNEQLRAIARTQRDTYRLSSKKGKSHISREIVAYVRSMDPPGRFLKKDAITGEWEDVGDDTAREKVSQVLRDAVTAMNDDDDSSPDGDGDSSGGEAVTPRTAGSMGNAYPRRADSAPTVVMSTPPAAATLSRYGRPQIPSSRRVSSSDDTARLRMTRSGHRRSYSPAQVVSMNPSYYHSPGRELHISSDDDHYRRREQQHPDRPHYYQQHQGQQPHHPYQSLPEYAFEPPPARQRHYSAPSAVAPVVSHDDIPRSPIQTSAPKKQRREERTYDPGAYEYSYAYAARPAAATAAPVPQGVYAASTAVAATEHEDEFDLFNGRLLQDESQLKTDRSKRDDSKEEGPYGDLSSKTF